MNRAVPRQAKDAVCLLGVEIVRLCLDTAKCIFDHINSVVEILAEIKSVTRNVTLITTSFCISLEESTPVLCHALTLNLCAVVQRETIGHLRVVELVNVLPTRTTLGAHFLTRDGCYT